MLVASAGKGLFPRRWALANELWQAGIATEFGQSKPDPSPVEQFGYANTNGIPLVAIFGDAELSAVSMAELAPLSVSFWTNATQIAVEPLQEPVEDY